MRLFWAFFGLKSPKSKMEKNHLFAKNFAWCLVPLCKMMNQNPKISGIEGELNTPLIIRDNGVMPLCPELVLCLLLLPTPQHCWRCMVRLTPQLRSARRSGVLRSSTSFTSHSTSRAGPGPGQELDPTFFLLLELQFSSLLPKPQP